MKSFFELLERYKQRLPTVALVVGFVVDIITFRNLNLFYSQIILATHLAIVAFSILIIALPVKAARDSFFMKVRSWLPVAQQYSTGNLLSAYVVLYSASASIVNSWIFFALLALSVLGNELFKLKKYQLSFNTSLFFLNLLLFFALALPIVVGSISVATFLLALIAGAVVFQIFQWILRFVAKEVFLRNRKGIHRGAQFVFVFLTVLYFLNIIPPIPLSLKVADFYHRVEKVGSEYVAYDEPRGFFEHFFTVQGKTLRLAQGEDAYLFSAVFAPARIDANIVHRWEFFDLTSGQWHAKNEVGFSIVGGRDLGYRVFSYTEDPVPGRWRVSVATTKGQVIGRAYVFVERVNTPPLLESFQQ
ncbi:MAG: DUF2914 domain-containing protein [Patescibacteria group bacterium]